jgi:hypothetical protein
MARLTFWSDWFSIGAIGDGREKVYLNQSFPSIETLADDAVGFQTNEAGDTIKAGCHFYPSAVVFGAELQNAAEDLGLTLIPFMARNRQHLKLGIDDGMGDVPQIMMRQVIAEPTPGHIWTVAELIALPVGYVVMQWLDGPSVWAGDWPRDILANYDSIIVTDQLSLAQGGVDLTGCPNLIQTLDPVTAATIIDESAGFTLGKAVRHQQTANYLQDFYGGTALFSATTWAIGPGFNSCVLLYRSSTRPSFSQVKTEAELLRGLDSFFLIAYPT